MGMGSFLIKLIVLILIVNLLFFTGYYLYQNFPGELQKFGIGNYTPEINLTGITSEVSQFYPNMRFNHDDISYFVSEDCSVEKAERVGEAFSIINQEVGVLSFSLESEDNADILIGCSEEEYEKGEKVFIAGEGGPTKIINTSLYPIILNGRVLLYDNPKLKKQSKCEKPITELHEIFHVFGFDHINDSTKIMYPFVECNQEINGDLIISLVDLYSVEPQAELYFKEVEATKTSRYMNFYVSITNQGLIDAKDVKFQIYADEVLINSSNIGDIEFGAGKIISFTNFPLPYRSVDDIGFELKTDTEEIDKINNFVELRLREV